WSWNGHERVFGESDRTLLEIATVLKAKLESGEIENAQITQLLSCLNKLGMIPHSREAVTEKKPLTPDEWDSLDGLGSLVVFRQNTLATRSVNSSLERSS